MHVRAQSGYFTHCQGCWLPHSSYQKSYHSRNQSSAIGKCTPGMSWWLSILRKCVGSYNVRILCCQKVYCLLWFKSPLLWRNILPDLIQESSAVRKYIASCEKLWLQDGSPLRLVTLCDHPGTQHMPVYNPEYIGILRLYIFEPRLLSLKGIPECVSAS